jgi:hypothetical protein
VSTDPYRFAVNGRPVEVVDGHPGESLLFVLRERLGLPGSKNACEEGECVGEPLDCDDGNPCTDDACDPAQGCSSTPNEAPCEDGDPCTSGDGCVE